MPLSTSCPACGLPMQLPDDAAGRRFACIRCGAGLVGTAGGGLLAEARPANPFAEQPGPGYGPAAVYFPPPMSREEALAKAKGPGVLLLMSGWLLIVAGIAILLMLLVPETRDDELGVFMVLAAGLLSMLLGLFAVFCGFRLKGLRSYGLVLGCVVLLLIGGFLICPIFAVAGIWPLIVLLDPGVKANFGRAA